MAGDPEENPNQPSAFQDAAPAAAHGESRAPRAPALWDRRNCCVLDANDSYAPGEFVPFAAFTGSGQWVGTPAGAPTSGTWTSIWAEGAHPNGTNSGGDEVWSVRRYVAEQAGDFTVDGTFGKTDLAGFGVRRMIFVDGVQRPITFDLATGPAMTVGGTEAPRAFSANLGALARRRRA